MPGVNAIHISYPESSAVLAQEASSGSTQNLRRVWADGCFDIVHLGHANNLRQCKKLGDYLIVGIHSDEEISLHKGPPVFTEEERYTMVKGIKWVDEVVRGAPYVTTLETLDKYKCDFCAHGNDITTTAEGKDTYQEVKDAGRYKEVERTQGVSTTALVKRMLAKVGGGKGGDDANNNEAARSPYTGSEFLPTTAKILEFAGRIEILPTHKVVYVDGAFDVLHPGHLAFLEAASKLGDRVLVGVHDDETVSTYKGIGYPIMNVYERFFSVLACKYTADVVIGAPYTVTAELLDHFNVSVVVHGASPIVNDPDTNLDSYEEPKRRGIYKEVQSGSDLTTEKVVSRIAAGRCAFEERNRKKEMKEIAVIKAMEKNGLNPNQHAVNIQV